MSRKFNFIIDDDSEVTVFFDSSAQGTFAYSILWDKDANIVRETDNTLYMDYYLWEIAYREIHSLMSNVESECIAYAVDAVLGPCPEED
jgi:hypothetical protein